MPGLDAHDRPASPATPGVARLAAAAAIAIGATLLVASAALVLVNRHDWWRGLAAATAVGVLTAAVSLPPLVWGLRRGLMHALAGFFIAAGAKMLASLGGALLAVYAGGYPPLPTLLLTVAFYLALLAAETGVVARSVWSMKAT